MSLWGGGTKADVCDLCGHTETARSVQRGPAQWGDFVFHWAGGERVCHWCAQRVYGYGRYIGAKR